MMTNIRIAKCYSWYNVFVDNRLLLKHLSSNDITELINEMHKYNIPYDMIGE